MSKIKSWFIAILSVVAAIFGAYLISDDDKKELENAKERIDKAGEGFNATHYSDVDSAAHKLDNVLSKLEGKDGEQ